MAITGAVEEEHFSLRMDRPEPSALALFPSARTLFNTRPDADMSFELLVRALIDGLHARLLAEASTTDHRRKPRSTTPTRTRTTSSRK
jgi:hypothetical protein